MNTRYAVSGFVYLLGVLAAALLVLWVMVNAGATQFIVPPPENEAEQFLKGLKANNFSSARDRLSQELRQSVSAEQLEQITRSIEQSSGEIDDVQGEHGQEQGDTAEAEVSVKLAQAGEQTITLPLVRENGQWRVNSIDPLNELVGP